MDYDKLGLKIGVEIHQRLESHKLFCKCPSLIRDDEPDLIVKRKLRAVAGETGEIDIAAKHELSKDQEFIYEGYSDTTCLVELDESPPDSINQDALRIVLQVAKILHSEPVDEIEIMRKTVIDGSNTAGFQRTGLVALGGYIDTSLGRVGIGSICIEEEAAKNVKEHEHSRTWRLDRLGIPLIEIQTEADIKSPEHAKEVCEKTGMILRSTGRIKRGLGSIRQDINLSIKNGARIEIKGFQDLRNIPKVVEFEIKRQLSIIESGKKVAAEVRKANPDNTTSFMRPMPGSARMYPESDVLTVPVTKEMLDTIELPELLTEKAIKLEKELGLNPDLAREVVNEELEIHYWTNKFRNIDAMFIANTLINTPKEIRARFNIDPDKIQNSHYEQIFEQLNNKKIPKDAVLELLVEAAKGNKLDFSIYKAVPEDELITEIKKIIENNQGASFNALMGEVMKKYRGSVDGKKIAEIIKKLSA